MEYTHLGETGLEVSRLCLGTMNFGSGEPWMVDDREHSLSVIERALELGITFFDTANVYSQGESEEILGEALADADRDRAELAVATKVYGPMADGPNTFVATASSDRSRSDSASASPRISSLSPCE